MTRFVQSVLNLFGTLSGFSLSSSPRLALCLSWLLYHLAMHEGGQNIALSADILSRTSSHWHLHKTWSWQYWQGKPKQLDNMYSQHSDKGIGCWLLRLKPNANTLLSVCVVVIKPVIGSAASASIHQSKVLKIIGKMSKVLLIYYVGSKSCSCLALKISAELCRFEMNGMKAEITKKLNI